MRSGLLNIALIIFFSNQLSLAQSDWHTIHNDFYWVDQNGERINTRSGCLTKFGNLYYWYGGTQSNMHREQYCYSSDDLVHWTSHGVVLRHNVEANRIDVIYNPTTKQYVMVLKYDGNGAHLGIATAEKPEGPFTFKSQSLVDDALMGDSSVYLDDDGKAYLCYVSWAVGTNAQHGIYLMSDDYLTLAKRIYLWDIRSREAPHIFERNGIYYYGTSRTAGIESSGTNYYMAKELSGPWSQPEPLTTPGSTNSWDSQVDMIIPIKGEKGTVYLYFGDRWIKDQQEGRNGDYIFLPMEFEDDMPILNYYQDWEINLTTGAWRKFDSLRNLASGKKVTASSENDTNIAKHVTDSKTYEDYVNKYWQSDNDKTQWIMVDLEKPIEFNRVILKWNTNAAKTFKIQTSNDATNWVDVFSTDKGSSYSVTDETFKNTTARYIRMLAAEPAPVPRGRGFGRTRRGNTTPAETSTGYSLFDFMVLKD